MPIKGSPQLLDAVLAASHHNKSVVDLVRDTVVSLHKSSQVDWACHLLRWVLPNASVRVESDFTPQLFLDVFRGLCQGINAIPVNHPNRPIDSFATALMFSPPMQSSLWSRHDADDHCWQSLAQLDPSHASALMAKLSSSGPALIPGNPSTYLGVQIADAWLHHQPQLAEHIDVLGLLKQLGGTPIADTPDKSRSGAIARVASLGLDRWLVSADRPYRLHQSNGSRRHALILASGLLSLAQFHEWTPEKLPILSNRVAARRLDKTLVHAVGALGLQASGPALPSWCSATDLQALRAMVRRAGLSHQKAAASPSLGRVLRM
jgi:hypothetical protein